MISKKIFYILLVCFIVFVSYIMYIHFTVGFSDPELVRYEYLPYSEIELENTGIGPTFYSGQSFTPTVDHTIKKVVTWIALQSSYEDATATCRLYDVDMDYVFIAESDAVNILSTEVTSVSFNFTSDYVFLEDHEYCFLIVPSYYMFVYHFDDYRYEDGDRTNFYVDTSHWTTSMMSDMPFEIWGYEL